MRVCESVCVWVCVRERGVVKISRKKCFQFTSSAFRECSGFSHSTDSLHSTSPTLSLFLLTFSASCPHTHTLTHTYICTHTHTSAQNLHPSRKGQNRLVETGFRLGLKNGRVNVPAAADAPGVREPATGVIHLRVRACTFSGCIFKALLRSAWNRCLQSKTAALKGGPGLKKKLFSSHGEFKSSPNA